MWPNFTWHLVNTPIDHRSVSTVPVNMVTRADILCPCLFASPGHDPDAIKAKPRQKIAALGSSVKQRIKSPMDGKSMGLLLLTISVIYYPIIFGRYRSSPAKGSHWISLLPVWRAIITINSRLDS